MDFNLLFFMEQVIVPLFSLFHAPYVI